MILLYSMIPFSPLEQSRVSCFLCQLYLSFYNNIISTVPHRQILRATFKPITRTLSIPYIAKEKNKKPFSLIVFEGIVQESNIPHAESWVESLMKTVYEGKCRLSFRQYISTIIITQMLALNVLENYWF